MHHGATFTTMTQEPKPLAISKLEAVVVLGGNRTLFKQCVDAGWIKPIGEGRKAVYDYTNIESAWKRLCGGEKPKASK